MTDELADQIEPAEGRERDRKGLVTQLVLNPDTLVGSWFHKIEENEIVWQGAVVGEPVQGVYLCEVVDSRPGAKRFQTLVRIENMTARDPELADVEWRFYDTDEQMREAYAEWTTEVVRRVVT